MGNVTADSELTYEYGVRLTKKTAKNDKTPASEQSGGEDVKSKGIVNRVIVYEYSFFTCSFVHVIVIKTCSLLQLLQRHIHYKTCTCTIIHYKICTYCL